MQFGDEESGEEPGLEFLGREIVDLPTTFVKVVKYRNGTEKAVWHTGDETEFNDNDSLIIIMSVLKLETQEELSSSINLDRIQRRNTPNPDFRSPDFTGG